MELDKKLSNNAIKAWIISRSIGLVVLIGIYLIIRFIIPSLYIPKVSDFLLNNKKIVDVIGVILVLFESISAYIEPFFEYKQWSYRITEEEIFFSEGIFFTKSVTIPIVRIQNIKLSEGPINRKFNLATIKIGTAGGDFEIPNLDKNEVLKIVEFLRKKVNENVREELQ